MTLHDAIETLLRQNGRPMTTYEIADGINENKWYQKRDISSITPYQIHGRTSKYPQLFNRKGSTVSLIGQPNSEKSSSIVSPSLKHQVNPKPILEEISNDFALLDKILMNEKNFKSAANIDNLLPNNSGLYCIRIRDVKDLPKPFDSLLKERNHNIIYIGIASQSLNNRFFYQELRAKGHGTFFRSIGAVLGFRPIIGSLKSKANKRNYTFTRIDETKIVAWINKCLIVNWIEVNGDLEPFETELIQRYLPLLNLAKNPLAIQQLKDLRAECVRIANS